MCESCNVSNINGQNCHEQGCPDAYMDYTRECVWCGTNFYPEDPYRIYCSDDCYISDNY